MQRILILFLGVTLYGCEEIVSISDIDDIQYLEEYTEYENAQWIDERYDCNCQTINGVERCGDCYRSKEEIVRYTADYYVFSKGESYRVSDIDFNNLLDKNETKKAFLRFRDRSMSRQPNNENGRVFKYTLSNSQKYFSKKGR